MVKPLSYQSLNLKIFVTLGTYIYIEASSPRVANEKARLLGGPFQGSQPLCLQFYYHMFGKHVGSLSFYQVSLKTETDEVLLWTRSGSFDAYWHKAFFDVESREDYKV